MIIINRFWAKVLLIWVNIWADMWGHSDIGAEIHDKLNSKAGQIEIKRDNNIIIQELLLRGNEGETGGLGTIKGEYDATVF